MKCSDVATGGIWCPLAGLDHLLAEVDKVLFGGLCRVKPYFKVRAICAPSVDGAFRVASFADEGWKVVEVEFEKGPAKVQPREAEEYLMGLLLSGCEGDGP